MKVTQDSNLFAPLSTEEAQTVQGGYCWRRSYRPTYYYYRPSVSRSYYPSFSYGYGYGGYGSSFGGSVSQSVNVNIRYDD